MDVLLIGSRGREHAMAIALKKDERVNNIFCIPGNGGLAGIATCIKMDIFDFEGIVEFLDANPAIGLTIVSPDELLAKGLTDLLNEKDEDMISFQENVLEMSVVKLYARTEYFLKYIFTMPEDKNRSSKLKIGRDIREWKDNFVSKLLIDLEKICNYQTLILYELLIILNIVMETIHLIPQKLL